MTVAAPPGKGGRPRRFDSDVERTMILDAALEAMTGNGYAATSVADVLNQAGLSTRSFYRHFESKDALIAEVVRREAETVEHWLRAKIAAASNPVEGVEVWLERTLDLFFNPRRASKTALFQSAEVVRSARIPEDLAELRRCVYGPLADALRSGQELGVLMSPTPELDAVSVFELVATAASDGAARKRGRRAARDHVVRFAWPALGITRAD